MAWNLLLVSLWVVIVEIWKAKDTPFPSQCEQKNSSELGNDAKTTTLKG